MMRKDYRLLAAALRSVPMPDNSASMMEYIIGRDAWSRSCLAVARALREDNPRFDLAVFYAACGMTESDVARLGSEVGR